MTKHTIAMIGGTGFIGGIIAAQLSREGYRLKLLTRARERAKRHIVLPTLELVEADVHDEAVLREHLNGAKAVINLTGILNESRAGDFNRVHAELPAKIVSACKSVGVSRLLHMSALKAASDAPSQYLRSKAAGERAVTDSADHLNVTVFRPSVVFGPGDDFFNRFAAITEMVPIALPLACAGARFSPVYVGDVANAFVKSLDDKSTYGQGYNLCGPNTFTLAEIVRYTMAQLGIQRSIIPLGASLSRLQAFFMERIPGKPFSTDNYRSMLVPSTCDGDDLVRLGIDATKVDAVVPTYLGKRNRLGNNSAFRSRAGRS
ncbi:MAG: complex I NDUFA9 subunit family protein [Gammaproteobacteria bacterium]